MKPLLLKTLGKAAARSVRRACRPILDGVMRRLAPRLLRRRFHAFGVGLPKSGTHSLAAVLAQNYRSRHEPEGSRLMEFITRWWDADAAEAEVREYLRDKDRRFRLEMDVASHNNFLLDLLLVEFPAAKFILTIRDPYTWLDSVFNFFPFGDEEGRRFRRRIQQKYYRLGLEKHPPEEAVLAQRGLLTLGAYFSRWAQVHREIIAKVPAERLLVIKTAEIGPSLSRIASFLGIPSRTLDAAKAHSFPTRQKLGILASLDSDYVEIQVRRHCSELLDRFFHGVKPFWRSRAKRRSHRHYGNGAF